ncbi:MAG: hypothetical protein GY799_34155 [Desulfobulbaceae bacterium]|nr:hypothetical protein [Desulfobulbaceae bacterium]
MRIYNKVIFIVFFTLSLGNLSVAAELQDGFMDYKWGESISQYPKLTGLYTKGDVTFYSNPGESFTVDDIAVDDVVYGFYQGSLFAVYIGIDALDTYDKIMLHMKLKYGFPDTKTSARDHLTTIQWKYQDVAIKLKTDEVGGKMKLAFYYRPISRDLKKDQIDEISEKSYRFFPIDKTKTPKLVPFLEF